MKYEVLTTVYIHCSLLGVTPCWNTLKSMYDDEEFPVFFRHQSDFDPEHGGIKFLWNINFQEFDVVWYPDDSVRQYFYWFYCKLLIIYQIQYHV